MAQLSIEENKNNNSAELTLSGELVLEKIPEVQAKLQAVSDKFAEIHVVLKDVSQIDMSAMQLLPALDKKMKANNKNVKFTFDLNNDKQRLIERSGFLYLTDNLKK
jgi:anti-anti-sigma factor